ncbi:MAG: energy transducer TonB [Calditrichaeota bacterium]|nr:energy transducer TonB [Calditrichota bacterium]
MSYVIIKSEAADLRKKSPLWMDISIIASLFIVTLGFYLSQSDISDSILPERVKDQIEVIDIPPTVQNTTPPPPARPSIPIEAEDDEEVDDVTIEDTEVDINEIMEDIQEPEEEDEVIPFYAVSKKPEIIKKVQPIYPDIARRAGVEANVVIQLIVSKTGLPTEISVLRGHPMLNEAAIEAVKQYRFSPGMQRDKPIPVKWAIPISFKLRN